MKPISLINNNDDDGNALLLTFQLFHNVPDLTYLAVRRL